MKQTTNYSLNKIELADSPPDITVLNPNFDKIDTELKNLSDGKAPNTHISASATDSSLGHVKLSDSVSSTSGAANGVAATPSAVKTAYDLANTANTAAAKAQSEVDALETTVSTLSSTVASNTTLAQKGVNDAATAQSTANNAQSTADSAVETANACLPLAGGNMTGTITMSTATAINKTNASYSAAFYGGTSSLDSAHLVLYGKDSSEAGKFALGANDGTNKLYLYGYPNGDLTWNDNDVITSAGGVMTAATAMTRNVDTDALQLHGGTSSANGSGIWLYGKSKTELQGVFRIRATAAGENVDLIGYPNGTLKWNGANVVLSVNGVEADAAGNVDVFPQTGNRHIRFSSGIQICSGETSFRSTGSTITFPWAFTNVPMVIATPQGNPSSWGVETAVYNKTTSSFVGRNQNNYTCCWIAIGYWK